ncbi:hypothetical protein A3A14_02005 [Candidatus Daviesbacteria bacterium RIFCSPLOWO2_01_FULL_43_38]|uniref:Uncharacterized protein n=1 Tax=Candidatus Daviesbacteria bacterium RIFCSPHIGHO2_12_FULL_43_11 TaxID=1797780 RepID=A0A1F5K8I5_9BACT|nr:MAG: hypothetical protein A2874_02765 [Candidatus Daviesbacteria bacterium RIFCSPHIGHO2_01_FULL_43_17]OGE36971.1 MAG: hypothetical protein A3E45_01880 [Candidatus Daviesbacteria bacterium RIFCSPHIGHO2_12_FULL_43_11]OGE63628.1 MAG: hypothetical protein A3A14_02005 [Candidatus Daviesbacteria bacterium RIFCSPLOWO2_01_FULL_43_38]
MYFDITRRELFRYKKLEADRQLLPIAANICPLPKSFLQRDRLPMKLLERRKVYKSPVKIKWRFK